MKIGVSRQWQVRPDVRVLIARAEGASKATLALSVSVGYKFENRPVTP